MKVNKGEFGYMKKRRKMALVGTIVMALIGALIFLTGLFLNDMSKQNIFTVIAVLFVLPGAKFLVRFLVTFPYETTTKERYELVEGKMVEGSTLYTDLVITSAEKVMHLDFAVVGNGQVICLLGNGKQELSYIRQYLTKGVRNWGNGYKVKVVESEKTFLAEVSSMERKEVDEEEESRVKSYLVSLIV